LLVLEVQSVRETRRATKFWLENLTEGNKGTDGNVINTSRLQGSEQTQHNAPEMGFVMDVANFDSMTMYLY
jgi:hypothetical protein